MSAVHVLDDVQLTGKQPPIPIVVHCFFILHNFAVDRSTGMPIMDHLAVAHHLAFLQNGAIWSIWSCSRFMIYMHTDVQMLP